MFKVRASPDDAYRYAKGEAIAHPSGHTLQLQSGPLDFMGVTDHGSYLGTFPALDDPENPLSETPLAKELRNLGTGGYTRSIEALRSGEIAALGADAIHSAKLAAWRDIIEAAERHNDPGRFTTLIGYEYTTTAADRGNLHRNVIFRSSAVPEAPFAATDSRNPEDLWRWLDGLREQGIEGLAIPHNSNGTRIASGRRSESYCARSGTNSSAAPTSLAPTVFRSRIGGCTQTTCRAVDSRRFSRGTRAMWRYSRQQVS